MDLVIESSGRIRALYGETIDLAVFGSPEIARASFVEPAPHGGWTADMRLLLGPVLGPFPQRSKALEAERAWLERHWLLPPGVTSPRDLPCHHDPACEGSEPGLQNPI